MVELNRIYNMDCIDGMKMIPIGGADLVLTDIPYGVVNRQSNGLRNLDKSKADIVTFDVDSLIKTLCEKTKGSVYVFCGTEQVSQIRKVMIEQGLSTRIIVWEKTNPSPMNGDKIWLSGVELCVYGKKKGATYNLHCQNSVIRNPCGKHEIHPTQKPVELFKKLIMASTNEGDIVLDPFMGSGTTAVACINTKRNYIGFELNKEYYDKSIERIKKDTQ